MITVICMVGIFIVGLLFGVRTFEDWLIYKLDRDGEAYTPFRKLRINVKN